MEEREKSGPKKPKTFFDHPMVEALGKITVATLATGVISYMAESAIRSIISGGDLAHQFLDVTAAAAFITAAAIPLRRLWNSPNVLLGTAGMLLLGGVSLNNYPLIVAGAVVGFRSAWVSDSLSSQKLPTVGNF